jgi:hypothetical protein
MRKRLRVVLLLVALAASVGAGVWFYVLGKGVPKGNWHGEFVTASGKQGVLQLVIGVKPPPRAGRRGGGASGSGGRRFEGTARHCIDGPASQHYELSGSIRSRDSFATLSPTGDPATGLRFGDLEVTWKGDSLTVAGNLQDFDGVNSRFDGANPDHTGTITVVLQKGGDADYEAACNRLAPAPG